MCCSFALVVRGQALRKPISPLDSITVQNAAFIGVVHMDRSGYDYLMACDIIKSYKCNKLLDRSFFLEVRDDRWSFLEGNTCLVFAYDDSDKYYVDRSSSVLRDEDRGKAAFYVDKNSRILQAEDSGKDIEYLLSVLPCYDSKLREKSKGMACPRDYTPVCGCDGVTYGNASEALKSGIIIFANGQCK